MFIVVLYAKGFFELDWSTNVGGSGEPGPEEEVGREPPVPVEEGHARVTGRPAPPSGSQPSAEKRTHVSRAVPKV